VAGALLTGGSAALWVGESARLIELAQPLASFRPTVVARSGNLPGWPRPSRLARAAAGAVNDGGVPLRLRPHPGGYDRAEASWFGVLGELEATLSARWALDLRLPNYSRAACVLFPTLIRMEMGYAPLFGCSRKPSI